MSPQRYATSPQRHTVSPQRYATSPQRLSSSVDTIFRLNPVKRVSYYSSIYLGAVRVIVQPRLCDELFKLRLHPALYGHEPGRLLEVRLGVELKGGAPL
eukprot:1749976-Pyramimonas_sp.AAC.1